jgi:hypothetical protein
MVYFGLVEDRRYLVIKSIISNFPQERKANVLLEYRLSTGCTVVEDSEVVCQRLCQKMLLDEFASCSRVEKRQGINVPGRKYPLDLGLGVFRARLSPLELHAFLSKSNLLLQVRKYEK